MEFKIDRDLNQRKTSNLGPNWTRAEKMKSLDQFGSRISDLLVRGKRESREIKLNSRTSFTDRAIFVISFCQKLRF